MEGRGKGEGEGRERGGGVVEGMRRDTGGYQQSTKLGIY